LSSKVQRVLKNILFDIKYITVIHTWKVVYYQAAQNKSPIYDFIENLNDKAQAKVANSLDLLEQYGIRLGLPHVKKISGTHLWELRILGKDNIRIFYIARINKVFLLLHGFLKKKQKTNKREIKVALERFEEYQKREC